MLNRWCSTGPDIKGGNLPKRTESGHRHVGKAVPECACEHKASFGSSLCIGKDLFRIHWGGEAIKRASGIPRPHWGLRLPFKWIFLSGFWSLSQHCLLLLLATEFWKQYRQPPFNKKQQENVFSVRVSLSVFSVIRLGWISFIFFSSNETNVTLVKFSQTLQVWKTALH